MATLTTAPSLTVPPAAVPADPHADIRRQVVEQLLRCCPDLTLAAEFYNQTPGSPPAQAAVGRFLAAHPAVPLLVGSPVAAWATGAPVSPRWRMACPPAPQSAFARLTFLAELYPGVLLDGLDAFDALTALEAAARTDLAS